MSNTPLSSASSPQSRSRLSPRRLLPLAVILAGIGGFFALGLHEYFTEAALRQNHDALKTWTEQNYALAVAAFIGAYVVMVALSLPMAVLFTPAAGFLFGPWLGGLYSLVAATMGATVIFLAARHAFADYVEQKAGATLKRMEDGFREDALNYMLVLRLVPLFPFWLVNLVPAVLGVRLGTYVLGTFIGMIPGALVYASVGNGLGAVFAAGDSIDFGIIFQPAVLLPLLGLATLSLVPVVYKRWKQTRAAS